jgi:transposase
MNDPTDITETQWQYIKKKLHIQERMRKHELREIWNAIFYLVKSGCLWRMLVFFWRWQSVAIRNRVFKPIHKRWIVERTFAWFGYNRRGVKSWLEDDRNRIASCPLAVDARQRF